jgi:hypothetical protein
MDPDLWKTDRYLDFLEARKLLLARAPPTGFSKGCSTRPETGTPTAILDLAWPDGLQEGLSGPVTLLLDEGQDTLRAASAAGYRYFQSVESFRRYVREEIRPGV